MRMLSRQLTVRLRLHLAWAPPAGLGSLHHPRRQEAHVTATYASTPPPSTFLDDTPMDDAEYDLFAGSEFHAAEDSPAAGKVDLLTTLMHEFLHTTGLGHSDGDLDLMSDSLGLGTRRLA